MDPVPDSSFDNRFTRRFGVPSGRVQTKVKDFMTDEIRGFIARSPFLVMATSDPSGRCDASPKGGRPGFVAALDDRRLLVPDVAGNRLFQSYLNMDRSPGVGLIFFIPGVERTVRVNGRATILDAAEVTRRGLSLSLFHADDQAELIQGILVEVQEAYSHCPRALKFSDLWNAETILGNQKTT